MLSQALSGQGISQKLEPGYYVISGFRHQLKEERDAVIALLGRLYSCSIEDAQEIYDHRHGSCTLLTSDEGQLTILCELKTHGCVVRKSSF